jgi:hypothetical protein
MARQLRTVQEQSEHLQVPIATLYQWSYLKIGPPVIKVGRYLRYRPEQTDQWLDERAKSS